MKRRKKTDEDGDDWLMSFGDITTLLFTFFVMIFACSSFGDKKAISEAFESIVESLKGEQKEEKELTREELVLGALAGSAEFTGEERSELLGALSSLMALKEEFGGVEIEATDLGLVVRAEAPILFDIAKAELKPVANSILESITKMHSAKECDISVYGHTCDLPIHTSEFPSNWELSSVRALSVVKFFQSIGINGEHLSVTGCADACPVTPNTSEENRKLNRRVEIYIDFRTEKL